MKSQWAGFLPVSLKAAVAALILSSGVWGGSADAQLTRERAEVDGPVDNVFWAITNIGVGTVRNLSEGSLNLSVAHAFGPVDGGINRFFGLDDGANTRIGFDYGFSDRFSAGIGRMTFDNLVNLQGKLNVVRQSRSGSMPVDLALKTSLGIRTVPGLGLEFSDRLSYFLSVPVARKTGSLSLQMTPMAAFFNSMAAGNPNRLFGLGILAGYELNDRFAISGEYLPVIGERNTGTRDALAFALNIDTGGHIFQIFFTSSQWHNEPTIMAHNRDAFWDGDIRFGFNIHRVFGLR